ncbi:hypothetical protein [Mycolicibacterium neoaurum]|uniref:hypothetical protein n=1 Tax=Mycolicibacterium neoaurum TaxID=1795 RepID=UPI001F4D0817|nr:hypothetical protein [Mycolicibacterium neoaurum]
MMTQLSNTECDLLASVPSPKGVTAGPWRADGQGHLVRDLSDGRIQRGNGTIVGSPVPNTDIALVCDQSVNMVDVVRHDLNELLQTLPRTAPLFACLDLVTALGHLRQAAVLIDRAADALEIEGVRR